MIVRGIKNPFNCKDLLSEARFDLPDELLAILMDYTVRDHFDLVENTCLFVDFGKLRSLRELIIDKQRGMVALFDEL